MHLALRSLALVVAIGLAAPALDCGSPVLARKKSKFVTRKFISEAPIEVPNSPNLEGSADLFPATLAVGGFRKGTIRDVELTLHRMQHGKFHDIDVLLEAPNGRNALVMSDAGADGAVANIDLTLDDESFASLPALGDPVVSCICRPRNNPDGMLDDLFINPAPSGNVALSTFDGGNPNGQWRLYVRDDDEFHAGIINDGWSLQITAKVKEKRR